MSRDKPAEHATPPQYWRKLTITKSGKYFIVLTLMVGAAGINTGNNLLYLMLGAMLTVIVTSGILSETNLRSIRVERRVPKRIFAGQPFQVELSITNENPRWTALSIVIEEMSGDILPRDPCVVFAIAHGQSVTTSYIATASRRGRHTLRAIKLTTRFPFAFFAKSRAQVLEQSIVVYPEIHDARARSQHGRELSDADHGGRGRGGEFRGLRDYQIGDNFRDIVWRKLIPKRRVVVREHTEPRAEEVIVRIDNYDRGQSAQAIERSVSEAASVAVHHIKAGHTVGLEAFDQIVAPSRGSAHLDRILTMLALLEFPKDAPQSTTKPRSELPHVF